MNDRKRIKLRRNAHEATEGVTAEFVRRAVAEALEARGLADFMEWKTGIEQQLQILRVIVNDMRTATALAYTNAGSARVKINELLEGMMSTLVNAEQLVQPGDIGELTQQQQLLDQAFRSFRVEHIDAENEAVEADDFEDPLEAMIAELETAETPPRRGRRR